MPVVFAAPIPKSNVQQVPLTAKKFSYVEYQRCQKEELHACVDLISLAGVLNTDSRLLQVTPITQNVMLVQKHYPADGQNQYYLLQSNGKLIDTIIDPRDVNSMLKGMYVDYAFMVTSNGKLTIKKQKAKTLVIVPLRITRACIACELIANASLMFTIPGKHSGSIDLSVLDFLPQKN